MVELPKERLEPTPPFTETDTETDTQNSRGGGY